MKKPAYIVTVYRDGIWLEDIIVFSKAAAKQELALRKRLNPGCTVTMGVMQ